MHEQHEAISAKRTLRKKMYRQLYHSSGIHRRPGERSSEGYDAECVNDQRFHSRHAVT